MWILKIAGLSGQFKIFNIRSGANSFFPYGRLDNRQTDFVRFYQPIQIGFQKSALHFNGSLIVKSLCYL
jgi:hypothetical protein